MALSRWGQVAILSLLFLFLCGANPGLCSQPTLDFIYIDSSVDEAAGGHTALRFGQTVFHYQYYDEGFFLLVKDTWGEFRYQYNDLQNRTLAIARLPLSSDAYHKVRTQFLSRYLLQKKRFAYLEQLEVENDFFQDTFSVKGGISISGLGFFSLDQKDDYLALSLRGDIEQMLGDSFLEDMLKKIKIRLESSLKNLQPETLESVELSLYLPSLSFSSRLHDYFELRELQEAVSVLVAARPVLEKMLLWSSEDIDLLNETELVKLKEYRERISLSIVSLLKSSRPGRGSALLLQAARFQAIGKSIKSRRIVTLDPFPEDSEMIPVDGLMSTRISVQDKGSDNTGEVFVERSGGIFSSRTFLDQLRYERLRDARSARENFFVMHENDDISYNQLEASFGRLWEIDQAGKGRDMVRIEGGRLLPSKALTVAEMYRADQEQTSKSLAVSRDNKALLKKRLLEVYDYNLFNKNCVTELFETVYSSFTTIEHAEKELGGFLRPGDNFSFVPFLSFSLVQENFPVASIEVLPSFRKRQLQNLYEQEGAWVLLEESNTLTSNLYYSWEKDSAFLFFTDDFFLLRPLLGTVNFLYAAISSLGGIIALPVDSGSLLRRSAKGMVFSLPELAFINIRKGTFPAVVYEK